MTLSEYVIDRAVLEKSTSILCMCCVETYVLNNNNNKRALVVRQYTEMCSSTVQVEIAIKQ